MSKKNTNQNGEAKAEKVSLSADQSKAWKGLAESMYDKNAEALEKLDAVSLLPWALEGLASRIDNKYSTAAAKLAALELTELPTLADLLPTSRKGEKATLVAKAFELATSNPAAAADILAAVTSGKVATLKEVIEKHSPKAPTA